MIRAFIVCDSCGERSEEVAMHDIDRLEYYMEEFWDTHRDPLQLCVACRRAEIQKKEASK